jgi:hypothetical protein
VLGAASAAFGAPSALHGKSSARGMITSAVCFPLPRKTNGVAASIMSTSWRMDELTGMPPGWQIAPDKRACIDWSGHVLGGRLIGNYARVLRSLL